MPRIVSESEKQNAINLMLSGDMGQRDMEKETGLSRPYLRKLARQVGYQFPRNGVEIIGRLCMCTNCSTIFRRPASKVDRAKRQFCDRHCKEGYTKGINHPNWRHGKSANTFSQWVKNQSSYKKFVEDVLEKDGHKCVISGRTDNLQVHHVFQKAEGFSPEKAFDSANGITLNFEVHQEIHELIREGVDFLEVIQKLKEKYNNG